YAWSTSPLRRYTDLVNQWQIIACARHGATAALAAPFKPKDAELFSIISAFDAAYSGYNGVQSGMERYWTLKHLQQQGITQLEATLIKEAGGGAWLVRADTLPLVLTVMGAQGLPRGARVRVQLGEVDLMALDVHGTVLAHLDATDTATEQDEDEDEVVAGPVHIAVDLNEADPAPSNGTGA
ncbi:MAG: Exoribonuclease 2, partial [Pseudomonadota bacterium]